MMMMMRTASFVNLQLRVVGAKGKGGEGVFIFCYVLLCQYQAKKGRAWIRFHSIGRTEELRGCNGRDSFVVELYLDCL